MAKLTACLTLLSLLVGKLNVTSDHCFKSSASHSCLLLITHVTARVSQQLYSKKKHSPSIRAVEFRHLLLLLSVFLDNLLSTEVKEHNSTGGPSDRLKDPTSELVEVANTFIAWYKLYSSITLGKDMEDIAELIGLDKS